MQLILEITTENLAAFSWNGSELRALGTVVCTKKTDIGYKDALHELLNQIGDFDRFESFSCSYFSSLCTLVPNALFSVSKPDEILQFSFQSEIAKSDVEYNRLPEWNMVLIYALPLWIKSVLILKTPRIVIQHEWAHLLRLLAGGSTIPTKSVLIAHEDSFTFVVRMNGQILHASVQEYQTAEDILYHVTNSFQQLNVQGKNELMIHFQNEELATKLKSLPDLFNRITLFKESKIQTGVQTHLQMQTLCV